MKKLLKRFVICMFVIYVVLPDPLFIALMFPVFFVLLFSHLWQFNPVFSTSSRTNNAASANFDNVYDDDINLVTLPDDDVQKSEAYYVCGIDVDMDAATAEEVSFG